jgi:hypothetical protein
VGRRTERQTGNAERKCYNFMQATTFFIISVDKITELYNLILGCAESSKVIQRGLLII